MDPAGTLLSLVDVTFRIEDFASRFDEAPRTLNSIRAQIKVVESGVKRIQEWMHFTDPTSKAMVQHSLQEAIATVDDSVASLKEDLDLILLSGPKMTKLLGRQGSDKWTQTKFAWNEARLSKHVTDMRECALLLSFTLTVCQLPLGRPAEHAIEELGIGARTLHRAHKSTRDKRRFMLDEAKMQTPEQSADFKVFMEGVLDAEKTLPEEGDGQELVGNGNSPVLTLRGSTADCSSPSFDFNDSRKGSAQNLPRTRGDELFLADLLHETDFVPVPPLKISKHFSEAESTSLQDSWDHSHIEKTGSNLNSGTMTSGSNSSPSPSQDRFPRKPVKSATESKDNKLERRLDNTYSSEKIMVVPQEVLPPEVVPSVEKQDGMDSSQSSSPPPNSPPPYMTRMSSQVFQSSIQSRTPPVRVGTDRAYVSPSDEKSRMNYTTQDSSTVVTSKCPELIQAVRDNQESRVQEFVCTGSEYWPNSLARSCSSIKPGALQGASQRRESPVST
jgi:hypothetical protein